MIQCSTARVLVASIFTGPSDACQHSWVYFVHLPIISIRNPTWCIYCKLLTTYNVYVIYHDLAKIRWKLYCVGQVHSRWLQSQLGQFSWGLFYCKKVELCITSTTPLPCDHLLRTWLTPPWKGAYSMQVVSCMVLQAPITFSVSSGLSCLYCFHLFMHFSCQSPVVSTALVVLVCVHSKNCIDHRDWWRLHAQTTGNYTQNHLDHRDQWRLARKPDTIHLWSLAASTSKIKEHYSMNSHIVH